MKRKSVEILAAAVVLFMSVSPVMAVVEFNDGGVWDIDYEINSAVSVDHYSPGMGTTVNMLTGGSIHYDLTGWEDSTLNILGGSIYRNLSAHHSSQVTVSGGSMDELRTSDSSQVTVSGGSVKDFWAYDSSQITVSGGSIGGNLMLWENAVLTIDGSDFAVDGTPVGYVEFMSILGGSPWYEPYRRLTGTLLNGDSLDSDFRIGNSAKIVLITEPAMLLLLGFGGIAFVRRRRQG
jgi:hypothetical protein